VTAASASADGTLSIKFGDGIELIVPPSPPHEAWELSASNGLKVVCMPSGSLSVWDPLR
jgi:hypothetical protein